MLNLELCQVTILLQTCSQRLGKHKFKVAAHLLYYVRILAVSKITETTLFKQTQYQKEEQVPSEE